MPARIYLSVLLVMICINNSWACLCTTKEDRQIRQKFNFASVVFEGKLIRIVTEIDRDSVLKPNVEDAYYSFDTTISTYTFQVTKLYKGNATQKEVILQNIGDTSCDFYFEQDQSYLIYAYETDTSNWYSPSKTPEKIKSYLTTSLCTGTKMYSRIKEKERKRLVRYAKRHEKFLKQMPSRIL